MFVCLCLRTFRSVLELMNQSTMAGKNVTAEMERFRRRARSVWDICISDLEQRFDTTEQFENFRRWLFWEMVLGDGDEAKIRSNDAAIHSTLGLREDEIRVLAANGRLRVKMSLQKDERANSVSANYTELDQGADRVYLCDLFDWNVLGALDHAFYLVKLVESERHPELNGFYGIVEPANCVFILHSVDSDVSVDGSTLLRR